MEGHIGKVNGQPNYGKAKECFEKSNIDLAHDYLGELYMQGYIGNNIPQPDYEHGIR